MRLGSRYVVLEYTGNPVVHAVPDKPKGRARDSCRARACACACARACAWGGSLDFYYSWDGILTTLPAAETTAVLRRSRQAQNLPTG